MLPWLLTLSVPFGYIFTQLGHADVAVMARHYARWLGGDFDPPARRVGEV